MLEDLWDYEKRAMENGYQKIAGIDEAGRGPLAGPVVSAAVILKNSFRNAQVKDSKKLTPKKREYLYDFIYAHALSIGIGIVDAIEIDRINILKASLLSMAISVANLNPEPDYLLIDGNFPITSPIHQNPIPKGDALSISIAAASIVAKVTRDRIMAHYDIYYPSYGFFKHKGYPTKAHREMIKNNGLSPIHRKSFKGVKEYINS